MGSPIEIELMMIHLGVPGFRVGVPGCTWVLGCKMINKVPIGGVKGFTLVR